MKFTYEQEMIRQSLKGNLLEEDYGVQALIRAYAVQAWLEQPWWKRVFSERGIDQIAIEIERGINNGPSR